MSEAQDILLEAIEDVLSAIEEHDGTDTDLLLAAIHSRLEMALAAVETGAPGSVQTVSEAQVGVPDVDAVLRAWEQGRR